MLLKKLFAAALLLVVSTLWIPLTAASAANPKVAAWFTQYDNIRREAQMSDVERERSRALMAQGMMANFNSSPEAVQEKQAAASLLSKMVQRYTKASAEMAALPHLGETRKLHEGYSRYFENARSLFADYLKIQGNFMARDAGGNPILGSLAQRKSDLETLDAANKDLDARLRDKFGIAPYAY